MKEKYNLKKSMVVIDSRRLPSDIFLRWRLGHFFFWDEGLINISDRTSRWPIIVISSPCCLCYPTGNQADKRCYYNCRRCYRQITKSGSRWCKFPGRYSDSFVDQQLWSSTLLYKSKKERDSGVGSFGTETRKKKHFYHSHKSRIILGVLA